MRLVEVIVHTHQQLLHLRQQAARVGGHSPVAVAFEVGKKLLLAADALLCSTM
jgi:hypothetical protein